MEYDDKVHLPCSCGSGDLRLYRCCDCSSQPTMCKSCVVAKHEHDQFHWVEEWKDRRFERRDLAELGLEVYLGHRGERCPNGTVVNMSVVDINGVHKARVVTCRCVGAPSRAIQLVQSRIFPSTVLSPRLGFTFRCLKDFHFHTRASKKSAYDYARALERMSNDPSRDDVNVSFHYHTCHMIRLK